MAGSRLQLLFLCYRDSGDSLLLKHNGHLSPRGVIQIQYQLKVIPILFSPALQHIYCCAVQLKALPGPGAARRAPVCASLPGGFGTLPGGYGVDEEGQSREGSARLGSGPAAGAAVTPPLCPAEPRGPPAPPPRDALSAPRGNSEPRGPPGRRAARAAGGPPLARPRPSALPAPPPPPPHRGDLPGPAAERPRPPAPAPAPAGGSAGSSGPGFSLAGEGGFVPNFAGAGR